MTIARSIGFAVLLCGTMMAQLAPSHEPAKQASPHGQMTVTQSGNPHGVGKSTLKSFASECGVTDMSESRVEIFAAKADGKWRRLAVKDAGESTDVNVARAWKDDAGKIRVVDMSTSNATGDVLQMSRMCFSPKGSLRKVSERYVNIPSCACGRSTDIAYAGEAEGASPNSRHGAGKSSSAVTGHEQGKQTKFEQSWYKVPSQEKLGADALKNAPKVIEYKSVAALPFANLLKEKNASSH